MLGTPYAKCGNYSPLQPTDFRIPRIPEPPFNERELALLFLASSPMFFLDPNPLLFSRKATESRCKDQQSEFISLNGTA